jgi:hypothetical protein
VDLLAHAGESHAPAKQAPVKMMSAPPPAKPETSAAHMETMTGAATVAAPEVATTTAAMTAPGAPFIHIPDVAGIPFFSWLGLATGLLVGMQVATGKRWIRVRKFKWHRYNGYAIVALLVVHAFYGFAHQLG